MGRMKRELKMTETKSVDDNNINESCLVIQTIWRQKYAEKLFNLKKIEKETLLGLVREITFLFYELYFSRYYLEEKYRGMVVSMIEIRKDVIYKYNISKN
jgi:hypothetical protein